MGRKLLSSYRYTPIQPVSVSEPQDEVAPAVHPAAPRVQAARGSGNNDAARPAPTGPSPPKYTPPRDLPSYEDVSPEPRETIAIMRVGRMVTIDDIPLGTGCTFWSHALMVTIFGIFGFLMSWCCGLPCHARRLGRTLGIGLDILKTAVYLRYRGAIMCWVETNMLPNFPGSVNGTDTAATTTGNDYLGMPPETHFDIVTYDGEEFINFCTQPRVNGNLGFFFPFMCILGSLLVVAAYAGWRKVQRLHKDCRATV